MNLQGYSGAPKPCEPLLISMPALLVRDVLISVRRGICMLLQVEPNDLGNLKDSMEHYLQDAAEPDFVEVLAPLLFSAF